jgi:hypothetical protein
MANKTPTIEPWAMDALRELIDIAGLLNDEMFLSVETLDAKQAIGQRLQALAESIALDGDPQPLEDDPDSFFDDNEILYP